MAKPELSIIIVSYNTVEITLGCIRSIIKSIKNIPYEIMIVDNASKDSSVAEIKKLSTNYSNIRLIINDKNVGFGKANNQGVEKAQSEYILFLNSDIIILNNAVEKLLSYYKKNEDKINFLGGKLFNKDMTPQASAGPFYRPLTLIGYLFFRGDQWGLTRSTPNSVKEVDWVSGACILTRKDYLNKINGFDENIFMYMDEIDLLYRAKKKGYRVFFYPEAHFIHLGSASSDEKSYSILKIERKSTPIIRVFEGLIWFYKKHFPQSLFFLKFLLEFKALIAIFVGKLTKNRYLLETYEKAFKIAKMA